MNIKYKNGPVKFGSLNRGSIFRLIDREDLNMKIIEPNSDAFSNEDYEICNAVCLNTGEPNLFDDDDDVMVINATLLIE